MNFLTRGFSIKMFIRKYFIVQTFIALFLFAGGDFDHDGRVSTRDYVQWFNQGIAAGLGNWLEDFSCQVLVIATEYDSGWTIFREENRYSANSIGLFHNPLMHQPENLFNFFIKSTTKNEDRKSIAASMRKNSWCLNSLIMRRGTPGVAAKNAATSGVWGFATVSKGVRHLAPVYSGCEY